MHVMHVMHAMHGREAREAREAEESNFKYHPVQGLSACLSLLAGVHQHSSNIAEMALDHTIVIQQTPSLPPSLGFKVASSDLGDYTENSRIKISNDLRLHGRSHACNRANHACN